MNYTDIVYNSKKRTRGKEKEDFDALLLKGKDLIKNLKQFFFYKFDPDDMQTINKWTEEENATVTDKIQEPTTGAKMKTKVRQTENKEEEEEEKEEERNNVSATTLVSVLWVNFME